MKSTFLALSVVLFFTQLVFAESFGSKPKACPSIAIIQADGVNDAMKIGDMWAGFHKSHYDTQEEWSLVIMMRNAKNKEDVVTKSNAAISLFSKIKGPAMGIQTGEWVCGYEPNHPDIFFTIAITPPRFIN